MPNPTVENKDASLLDRPPPPPVFRLPSQENQQTFQVQQPQSVEQEQHQHQQEEQHDPIEPVVKDHSYGSKTGQVPFKINFLYRKQS